jgi:uncharacterized protein YbcI
MAQRTYLQRQNMTEGLRLRLFMPSGHPILTRRLVVRTSDKGISHWGRYVMESAIRNAIIKFEQEFMGRGPDEVRAFVVRDIVVVRLKGVLTPAERQLAKTAEGVDMVKRLRQNLIAQGRDKLSEQVSEITGAKILGVFTDIDVQLGERVFVFTVDRDIQGGNVR